MWIKERKRKSTFERAAVIIASLGGSLRKRHGFAFWKECVF